ncbi:MAG: PilZ domain-containing protein [Deltaproteobacteria bacterium]|nr:PilZ domain-containing protein [Deltaproteobacteria bacterium]
MAGGVQDRRHVRRSVRVAVQVAHAGEPGYGEISLDALDLSQSGAFLQSDLLLETGDVVTLTFTVPGEIRSISARARVVWATRHDVQKGSPGMGVEFVDLSDADRQIIGAFVRSAR